MKTTLDDKIKKLGLAAVGIAPAVDEVLGVFDWAKSVVTAAICYLLPDPDITDTQPRGLIARVARGADYHVVLREKLAHLVEIIKMEHPRARLEICVDTCPIPERKLAVLGGIAWRGKNGNVFVDGCGSYAALGEIITDIDLPISKPLNIDRCGDCHRCIDACPTSAIIAPNIVDTSRCLSAITQMSGSIPVEIRSALGSRIYGCDTCQEVCPQNAPLPDLVEDIWGKGAYPDLIPLIAMTPAEFRRDVKDTSIGWIRRTRIRRNAAIAAGNLRCEGAVSALKEMLRDENPVLRETAEWALEKIECK